MIKVGSVFSISNFLLIKLIRQLIGVRKKYLLAQIWLQKKKALRLISIGVRLLRTLFRNSFRGNYFFFISQNVEKFQIVVAIIFPLYNENLNSLLTRLRKLFKGGNYSQIYLILSMYLNLLHLLTFPVQISKSLSFIPIWILIFLILQIHMRNLQEQVIEALCSTVLPSVGANATSEQFLKVR